MQKDREDMDTNDREIPEFDTSGFTNKSFVKKIEKPWGYEFHLVSSEAPYMLKIIHINSGKRLSLQLHDKKTETWTLISGKAKVVWENSEGELIETELEEGVGFTSQTGQRHRLVGVTDCDIVEASTPEIGTTFRLEDDFQRSDETPEEREKRDKEAK